MTGWFSDRNYISTFSLYNVYIFLCGATVFFFPLCNSYGLYAFMVALYGFFTTYFILKTIVLVELLGLDNLTSAFSLLALFEGKHWNIILGIGIILYTESHSFPNKWSFMKKSRGIQMKISYFKSAAMFLKFWLWFSVP